MEEIRMLLFGRFEGNPSELELGVFEIQDQPYLEAGDAQIIKHLADFVVSDSLDGFRIHYDFSVGDEVGNVFADFDITIMNRVAGLLKKRNSMIPEIDSEPLFIWFLVIAMPNGVKHIERTADDLLCFQNMKFISSICVHPVHLRLNYLRQAEGRLVR